MEIIGNYRLGKIIGSGASSKVVYATHISLNAPVAIKIVPKKSKNGLREISLMKKINHPFIVQFYEFLQDELNYYIVMEYVEGISLLEFVKSKKDSLDDNLLRHFVCEIVSCINYLHNVLNIVHRDLKLENVMVDKNMNIKLIDFGYSNIQQDDDTRFKTACGSTQYFPPEIILGKDYSFEVDIWAFGIMLYCMLFKRFPFQGTNTKLLFTSIIEKEPFYNFKVNCPYVNMISKCLMKNPNNRPKITDIMSNSWISSYPNKAIFEPSFGLSEGWIINKANSTVESIITNTLTCDMSSLFRKSCITSSASAFSNPLLKRKSACHTNSTIKKRQVFLFSTKQRKKSQASILPQLKEKSKSDDAIRWHNGISVIFEK